MQVVIRMQLWAQDHRPLAMALVVVLLGIAAGCVNEGGMYQGGNDDTPYYR